jgi:kynureninase
MSPPDQAACARLDAEDPLAFARARFQLPEGVIYLDGNSLGPLPRSTPERLSQIVSREWGRDLIQSWNTADWMGLPHRVGARLAPLIGAFEDEVVAADSTSVNLFKLAAAAAALLPERTTLLTEAENFPSDLYVLQSVAEAFGRTLRVVPRRDLEDALDEHVGLVCLTQVDYRTGALRDLSATTQAAHAAGAMILWDLSHSAGALEVDLRAADADFAIGCGYKYLNGGPGAPGYMMAARRHHARLRQPIPGWIGHARPFAFEPAFAPASGMTQMLTGTPAILALAALEEGLKTFDGVQMAQIRRKSQALGELFLAVIRSELPGVFELACPADPAARGSQISLRHPDSYALVQALIEAGVVGDHRDPDVARFGLTPLTLSYADVLEAARRLVNVVKDQSWRAPRFRARRAVT